MKTTIENLKCWPNDKLREAWIKARENEKSTTQAADENPQAQGPVEDYEYYDDTQLNGTLFYVDIRDLLNCTDNSTAHTTTTVKPVVEEESRDQGMDIAIDSEMKTNEIIQSEKNKRGNDEVSRQDSFTTTRLVTVSAKPEDSKIYDNMASDEAKPEKGLKAHRSIQDEPKGSKSIEDTKTNSAYKNVGCYILLVSVLSLRLHI